MKKGRAAGLVAALAGLLVLAYGLKVYLEQPQYLTAPEEAFIALFIPPPVADSIETRRELDVLEVVQRERSPQDVEEARADRKTEVWQFAAALGLKREEMDALHEVAKLADRIETDVRPYVRAAKHRFRRLRPYEVDSTLEPCVDNVRGDLSYPSGHATYAYVVAYLLGDLVPERRPHLISRALEFSKQRLICGVHFPSDIIAGRTGAKWLAEQFLANPAYRAAAEPARKELRAAMHLPANPG